MSALVTALGEAITLDSLIGTITSFIPVVAVVLGFSFAYYVLRRIIKGASKGRARI